jgi:hypothetical protein
VSEEALSTSEELAVTCRVSLDSESSASLPVPGSVDSAPSLVAGCGTPESVLLLLPASDGFVDVLERSSTVSMPEPPPLELSLVVLGLPVTAASSLKQAQGASNAISNEARE